MPLLTPPPSKPQRGIRATFAALMDGFVSWLVDTFYNEMLALVAAISALVAGGASKIPYKVDLGTTMADPAAGWLRLNNATQNTATAMVVDVIGSDNIDYTSLLYTFDDSTSTVLGQIRVEKMGDASKFLVFNLTAMSTPTGYRQFTLACTGYSTASPFAQGDPVVLSFTRTGDKGDIGQPTPLQMIKVSEQYASNNGGGFSMPTSDTVYDRTLNTVDGNTITGASLASGSVTLPAGSYRFRGRVPGLDIIHRALLWNVTDNVLQKAGSSVYNTNGTAQSYVPCDSFVSGFFTITSSKSFKLKQYVKSATNANGAGLGVGQPAYNEIYSELEFEKYL